jgi:hypothetical protein
MEKSNNNTIVEACPLAASPEPMLPGNAGGKMFDFS